MLKLSKPHGRLLILTRFARWAMRHNVLSVFILIDSICIVIISLFAFPSWKMEILTLLAVLVALFKDDIYSFYLQPALVITASLKQTHFYEVRAIDRESGSYVGDQAWFSVIVENKGLRIAKNVTLIFNGIESNKIANFCAFRGLTLKRGWIEECVVRAFHRHLSLPYGFCYIDKRTPGDFKFSFLSTPTSLSSIRCDSKEPGWFKFEIIALSDNAAVAKEILEIRYNGEYKSGFQLDSLLDASNIILDSDCT